MLQKEFEERVGINVSYEEYLSIEKKYMECDLDKDEFCAQWVKKNAKRIKEVKATIKAAEKEQKLHERLFKIMRKVAYYRDKHKCSYSDESLSIDFFSKSEWQSLTNIGITKMLYSDSEAAKYGYITPSGLIVVPHARISDTAWQIHKYLF